jgi:hypothetical protein
MDVHRACGERNVLGSSAIDYSQVHERSPAHELRHACGYALANRGHDTRALQAYLGHKNIQHTVGYTELAFARSSLQAACRRRGPFHAFNEESAPLKAMLDAAKAILDAQRSHWRESRIPLVLQP